MLNSILRRRWIANRLLAKTEYEWFDQILSTPVALRLNQRHSPLFMIYVSCGSAFCYQSQMLSISACVIFLFVCERRRRHLFALNNTWGKWKVKTQAISSGEMLYANVCAAYVCRVWNDARDVNTAWITRIHRSRSTKCERQRETKQRGSDRTQQAIDELK